MYDYKLSLTLIADKYNSSGIYKITFHSCPRLYIGQTGRTIKKQFKEHPLHNNMRKNSYKFAAHIMDHMYGIINEGMIILLNNNKEHKLYILEELQIYKHFKTDPTIILNKELNMFLLTLHMTPF